MWQPEKFDTRPRVDRFNWAASQYLGLLYGREEAHRRLEQLLRQQRAQGLKPKDRVPRVADRMPGAPVIDLSAEARIIAESATRINWFSNAGQPLDSTDGAVAVADVGEASRSLSGARWHKCTNAASEAITLRVAARSQEVFDELWNEVAYAVQSVLGHRVRDAISQRLAVPDSDRETVVSEVQMLIVMACHEEHWSTFVDLPVRWYREAFLWLLRGRLPCGVVGHYPTVVFKVW